IEKWNGPADNVCTAGCSNIFAAVTVGTSGTDVFLYWGNGSASDGQTPAGVWDASFQSVHHLANGTTLSGADATANARTASFVNAPTAVAGEIDEAANFASASTQYATVANYLNNPSTLTVSAWLKTSQTAQDFVIAKQNNYATGPGWLITLNLVTS